MPTLLAFFVVALAAQLVSTAPKSSMPAECSIPKEEMAEVSKCCKYEDFTDLPTSRPVKKCLDLVKNLPSAVNVTVRKSLKPEGFDCFDDCVLSQLDLMGTDKKINTAKIAGLFKGDWVESGKKALEKCSELAASKTDFCSSGADIFISCMIRERYMNCPEKFWTKSDACQQSLERLKKCPLVIPYQINDD